MPVRQLHISAASHVSHADVATAVMKKGSYRVKYLKLILMNEHQTIVFDETLDHSSTLRSFSPHGHGFYYFTSAV